MIRAIQAVAGEASAGRATAVSRDSLGRIAAIPAPGADAEFQSQMLEHSGLVHNIAWQVHRRWRTCVERDDLVQAGFIGLAQALRRYTPGRAEFSTFAYERVRGEMRDFLRRQPWYRFRSVAEHTRDMADEVLAETTIESIESEADAGRNNRGWLRSSVRRLALVRWIGSAVAFGALDSARSNDADRPDEAESRWELICLIRRCIDELPVREGSLIRMTYFDGLTFEEAGARLGVHKSTVSRLHAQILDGLAKRLRGAMLLEGVSR